MNPQTDQKENFSWQRIGLVILSIRFVQGWIFWAGGSRRFIYDPQKLDPHAGDWLANKLQAAVPGALLGVGHVLDFILQHFWVLYITLILFSLAELIAGLALMLGFFTRAAALCSVFLSLSLMIVFGWEGGTCLDEWTMAVSNFAMGLTLYLSGAPIYSLDHLLLKRYPSLKNAKWFNWLASGDWGHMRLKIISLISLFITVLFTTTTYNYYRGAIFSKYHPGPVSATVYHLQLTNGFINADGIIRFKLAVDDGNTSEPYYILQMKLYDQGVTQFTWFGRDLSLNPKLVSIHNVFHFNEIKMGSFGLVTPVSAKAQVILTPSSGFKKPIPASANYRLTLIGIDGKMWTLPLKWRPTDGIT